MATRVADLVLMGLQGYGAAGTLFALAFALRGAAIVEPSARGGTLGFRVVILPGAIVLWPYLLVRWLRAEAAASAGKAPR